jgi:23S rRNA (guanine2445-N2)-methyltransferase / 23S rRNA (guanine2069-N7)-methyltransferase
VLRFVASAPRGFGDLLARELEGFGAADVRERALGVEFSGSLEVAYRACLESRVASRVFLVVARFDAPTDAAFYAAVRAIDWREHIHSTRTLACDFSGRHPALTHTGFGALRLKDAICDSLRAATGRRPDIAAERPAVRVHAHANRTDVTVSIDLSGEGLHRRGYRADAGEAPLRENLAAGVLLRAGWPEKSQTAAEFLDPMCGAGTLVIEAALIAARIAPGARRRYYGFLGWVGHEPAIWEAVKQAAEARAAQAAEARAAQKAAQHDGRDDPRVSRPGGGAGASEGEGEPQRSAKPLLRIRGFDRDASVLDTARENAERAGVAHLVSFERRALADAAPASEGAGFLATNPPYGVRLEDRDAAHAVMRELGTVLRKRFVGWDAAVLAGSPEQGLELGLRAARVHKVWNGALECRLLRVHVARENERDLVPSGPGARAARIDDALADSPGAKMFANRIGKNLKQLGVWAERERVSCYRIYDADMPEYSFAVDRYLEAGSDRIWLYVQEYAAPASIDAEAVKRRRAEALAALPHATGVPAERIQLRRRRRRARGEQYEKIATTGDFKRVEEGGLAVWVNLTGYLDTGLFLDHRMTRARLRAAASGVRFLNLFAYTGSASVYAAAGGARSTTSVDMSATYVEWARRNLAENGFTSARHELVRADCIAWLESAAAERRRFDLIFLDPPTFSHSKRMTEALDVQRDHPVLIERAMRLLAPGGMLVFSTNAQKFRLETALAETYEILDISRETLPKDFERNPRIHQCFEVRHRTAPRARGTLSLDRGARPSGTHEAGRSDSTEARRGKSTRARRPESIRARRSESTGTRRSE